MRIVIAAVGALTLVVLLVVPMHVEAPLLGAAYQIAPRSLDPYVWQIVEWGGNVAVFALLAALLCLPLRPRNAFVVAALLSAACELAQLVIPTRQASVGDFVLNTTGAAIACGVCAAAGALHRTVRRHRAGARLVTQ